MGAIIGLLLAGTAVVAAIVTWWSRRRFHELMANDVTRLFSGKCPEVGPRELAARWDALPAPARRYFAYAIPEEAPPLHAGRLKYDGFLRSKPDQAWLPIAGVEYFTPGRPGFVWEGSVPIASLFSIDAHDRLLAGRGQMPVKLFSAFTIGRAAGPEIDQAALVRWLTELAWFPLGFAGELIRWEPVDERHARVIVVPNGLPASATLEVDEEGRLVRVTADRYRHMGKLPPVLTSWAVNCGECREFSGFRLPGSIEISWRLPEGDFSFSRWRVIEVEFNSTGRY